MEAPLVPEVLMQHGQFVRALAQSILRDAHAAEDVAQETWLRYVERPPADDGSGARRWLSVVTRNFALNLGRRERQRAARDRAAARPEAIAPPQEGLEHAEMIGIVVEAVLALEEPYRETIVARFYRGLDTQAIAAESGTTDGTVRSRERRALEMLRERLDRRFRGERAAWAAALARIAGSPAGAIAGAATGTWIGLAVALPLIAIGAGAWLWTRGQDRPGAGGAQAKESAVSSLTSDPSARESSSLAAVAGSVQRESALSPAAPPAEQHSSSGGSSSDRANATNASLAEIRGRFVFPGGAPAAGVTITVQGWGAGPERTLQYGEPENWVDPQVSTGADGRFTVTFDPPRAFQFMVHAKAPGHAQANWRWSEILPGSTLDLGEVELPVGGTIEGRIVDAQGNALAGEGWSVYASTPGPYRGEPSDWFQVIAHLDGPTASFRLEEVWPTKVELRAVSDMVNSVDGPRVEVRSGETTTADIVYSGPNLARRITVGTYCEPFYAENPAPEHIRLVGPGSEERTASPINGSTESFSFDDLPTGIYTLEIDDPRFLSVSRTGLEPGSSVNKRVVGSAALRLSVIGSDGSPVELYAVRVTLRTAIHRPNEFEVHDGKTALEGGLVRGMLPGDYTVAIRCADGASGRCEVEGLASGETRDVRIDLGDQRFVSGRVVYPDGNGVAGASLLPLTPAEKDDSDASPTLEPGGRSNDYSPFRREISSAVTDDTGAFRIDATNVGPFLLRARSDGSQAFSPRFTLEQARTDLDLVLPLPGSIRGRVHAPPGTTFDGLALWIAPSTFWGSKLQGFAALQRMEDMRESLDHGLAPLRADGTFELTHLPSGPSRAFLVITEEVRHGFGGVTDDGIGAAETLGNLTIPAGGLLERDFEAQETTGMVTLEMRVNGVAAPFLEVSLSSSEPSHGPDVDGKTDAAGRFGPKRVQTGTWSVHAQDFDAGWSARVPESVFVEASKETSAVLDIQVADGALVCTDSSGRPIADEYVTVLRESEIVTRPVATWFQVTTRKTDANGRLELHLVPGEYGLMRGEYEPGSQPQPAASLTWTATGPLVERVRL